MRKRDRNSATMRKWQNELYGAYVNNQFSFALTQKITPSKELAFKFKDNIRKTLKKWSEDE